MPNLIKSINLTQDDKNTLESILRQSTVEPISERKYYF